MEREYTLWYNVDVVYFDEEMGEFYETTEICSPIFSSPSKDEVMELFDKKVLECGPYLLEFDDPKFEKCIGYGYSRYEIEEEIGDALKYELIKEKNILNCDKNLTIDFLKKLLKKVNKENIIFHKWIENPTAEELLKLQKLDKI